MVDFRLWYRASTAHSLIIWSFVVISAVKEVNGVMLCFVYSPPTRSLVHVPSATVCVRGGKQMAAGGPSPSLQRWEMICDHSAIKADQKGMAETVSRLMLWVVSAADFSDRTLTPPPRLAGSTCGSVCERWCGFQKQRPRMLKRVALNQKKGKRPSHGVYFDVPPLPVCSWKKNLNFIYTSLAEMPLNSCVSDTNSGTAPSYFEVSTWAHVIL